MMIHRPAPSLIQAEAEQHSKGMLSSNHLPSSQLMSEGLGSTLHFTTLLVLGQVQKTHQFRCLLTLKWSQDTLIYTSTRIMVKLKDAGFSIDLGRTQLLEGEDALHFFVCVLIHNMTWANLRERTLITNDKKCSMAALTFKRTGL